MKAEPDATAAWVLMLLALRQLAAPATGASGDGDGAQDDGPWHDWPSLVHPGLGAAAELARLDGAAAAGDMAAFLAVLTAACAFPAPDGTEPWAALLLLAWALREELGEEWALPGEVLDAAVGAAVHRRGPALLRDLVEGGAPVRQEVLGLVEDRLAQVAAEGRTVTVWSVGRRGWRPRRPWRFASSPPTSDTCAPARRLWSPGMADFIDRQDAD